ncbi:MAG: type II toxin-antitoxin system VapC family toxin [Thermoleophilia bacterium]
MFVLDCSVTMAWVFDDEDDAYAAGVRDRLDGDVAVVPAVWPLEVGNALLVAERGKRISRAEALRFVGILHLLPIDVDATPTLAAMDGLLQLAHGTGLSLCDAGYLELAATQGLPLASLDKGLRRAARQVGVALVK